MSSSPFLLEGVVLHHLNKWGGPVAEKIKDSNYVDNVITGVETEEAAKTFYTESMPKK
jgi:hypothetical protein